MYLMQIYTVFDLFRMKTEYTNFRILFFLLYSIFLILFCKKVGTAAPPASTPLMLYSSAHAVNLAMKDTNSNELTLRRYFLPLQ